MKQFFSKFGWTLIYLIMSVMSIALVMFIINNPQITESKVVQSLDQTTTAKQVYEKSEVPTVKTSDFNVENQIISPDTEFDYSDFADAKSSNGIDLKQYITCREIISYNDNGKALDHLGNVMNEDETIDYKLSSKRGEHDLVYTLNWNGITLSKKAKIYVNDR